MNADACKFEVDVTAVEVAAFAELTGDRNPLHVDPEYAATTEFGRPIVHGALLVGLVSRVLGMHIPGTKSLMLSMRVRFPNPLPFPSRVEVTGALRQFNEVERIGTVTVSIVDLHKRRIVLEAEVAFALHAEMGAVAASVAGATAAVHAPSRAAHTAEGRRKLLVTGATGGVGDAVRAALAGDHELVCLARQARRAAEHCSFVQADVEDEAAFASVLDALDPSGFYGVVHMTAPNVSRAFVSDDLDAARRHLRHAVEVPLLLARWARRPGSAIKRVVLVGSTYGTKDPKPQLGAYSLAKAAMEHLPRLLTMDLAAQGATVNLVAPGVMPVGLNAGMPDRAKKTVEAHMATGQLLAPTDVGAVIRFLLSAEARQLNGAVIPLDGGLLA